MKGTYRIVVETDPALEIIREAVRAQRIVGVTWWLDALATSDDLVATSDSAVLDRVHARFSFEQMVCARLGNEPNVRNLRSKPPLSFP